MTEGPRHYRPGPAPRIPLEFADAAFRYGHSQVREEFELNSRSGRLRLFPDLLGFRPVAAERPSSGTGSSTFPADHRRSAQS